MPASNSPSAASVERVLDNPKSAEELAKLLNRSDDLLMLLDMVEGTLKRGPEYAENINSLVEQLRKFNNDTDCMDELSSNIVRLRNLSESESLKRIEAKVTDEKTAEAIVHLLDNLYEISMLVDMLVAGLKRGPEYADNINDLIAKLREGITETSAILKKEFEGLNLPALKKTALKLSAIVESPHIQNLMDSEIFGADSVGLVDRMAKVAVEAARDARQSREKIGFFDIFRMMGDPDVQTTLRFAFGFAKKFGRELSLDARAIDSKKSD